MTDDYSPYPSLYEFFCKTRERKVSSRSPSAFPARERGWGVTPCHPREIRARTIFMF
jgi:hypothetical protein